MYIDTSSTSHLAVFNVFNTNFLTSSDQILKFTASMSLAEDVIYQVSDLYSQYTVTSQNSHSFLVLYTISIVLKEIYLSLSQGYHILK